MPRYDYICHKCKDTQEFTAGMSEIVVTRFCTICKEHELFARTFTPSGNFILKGGGWAKDNYCKKDGKDNTNVN